TATPAPFQQMIQFSESSYSNYITYNGNIANFEFFTQSGSIIPAWIESNNSGTITVWLNLANGVPASNSITVYLGFASQGTNLLSSSGTTGIGEAPQLSSTYAQYDDGASVFNNYWNFAGTSLPTGWEVIGRATVTVNNGVSISGGTGATYDSPGIEYTSTNFGTSSFVIDSLSEPNTGGTGCFGGLGTRQTTSTSLSNYQIVVDSGDLWGACGSGYYSIQYLTSSSSSSTESTSFTINQNTFYIITLIQKSSTAEGLLNYGSLATASPVSIYNPGNNYLTYLANYGGAYVQWLRTRAYPPNGVMPSYSFGSVS
ncbi:MAG: hypothetical protein ACP5GD_03670, partial [Candidatus Micrarchaeia archaeon]